MCPTPAAAFWLVLSLAVAVGESYRMGGIKMGSVTHTVPKLDSF